MENNINLTPDAAKAIQALQHPCGTYQFYRSHLDRLFTYVLNNSDEIGMSDNEAMNTLRALNALRADIADIAGQPAPPSESVDPFEHIALTAEGDHLDETREMLHDINEACNKIAQVKTVVSEAIQHARNTGGKYDSIAHELADVKCDLEALDAQLDALMVLDTDTHEPRE